MTMLVKSKMVRVDGIVYCHTHTEVHEDTLDPYGEGYYSCYGQEYGVTSKNVHRLVYTRLRKGDWDEEATS